MAKSSTSKKSKVKLSMEKELIWKSVSAKDKKAIFDFAEDYKHFLTVGKSERIAAQEIVRQAEKAGFKPIDKVKKPKPGLKIYHVNREKSVCMAVLGKSDITEGANLVASHIDAPRLDLKQNPLYEDSDTELALFKTHYYGGVKKYQWVSIPLALYGRVIRSDGSIVDIAIGDEPGDPVFTIADLLIHLSRESQGKRRLMDGIKGEELNVLTGSIPVKDKEEKAATKMFILQLLNQKYGMVEEDFTSAEFELVPAGPAMDVGLDRSMIGGYGQDDRASAFPSMRAIINIPIPERTAITIFFDKEEIGSESNTAAQSRFVENFIGKLVELYYPKYNDSVLRGILEKVSALSSDVNAAINPTFKDVHEMRNASRLGYGIVITKYTGHGGKGGANDANAEYTAKIRLLFNKAKVPWQIGELGKVDEGGGGTVAKYLARLNMDIIDCGPSLLGMHSPFEITNKADIYYSYKAFAAFMKDFKG
jgi:aspartyl aminopeptidase